ncbi:Hypothetical protein PHPALM_37810 [Phytophthora palmivora]|uniref:Uncharacterized protein n=1 Tax=Phytophthora palmivora TaxID=4796 RepID=A0A2P4WWH9_9STRA|nr:Hypothetical protein PHPALM_37810 [Phytophthora palmivora]
MTQLLEEQDKNQQLRDRIQVLEVQIAENSETSSKLRDVACEKEKIQSTEKEQVDRIKALEEQVRLQETTIARLKQDKEQLKVTMKQLKKTGSNSSNDQRSDTREVLDLRTEVEDVTRCLHEFLANVELWKNNSKKEMQNCDDKTDLSALLEHVWLDFPQFPGISSRPRNERLIPSVDKQEQSIPGTTDEQDDAILFLKKRLRQREDELRQTHVKYVELKELCARQCVREADLQNFINEHRLRGNLVIRKKSGAKPNATIDNQEQEQDDYRGEQRPSTRTNVITGRGTNSPTSYERDEENNSINNEYLDNQEDNGDNEEEDAEDAEFPVRTPKIFVQVGRNGVYEHASPTSSAVAQKLAADRNRGKRKTQSKQQQQRIERIRLVPSPSLTQRYERVPTPTTTSARRKKSILSKKTLRNDSYHPAKLGECPPGCGSRPSFMGRKPPTPAARAMPAKRPSLL